MIFAADPTGGAYADALGRCVWFATNVVVPALFALAGIALAITVGLRWIKHQASMVAGGVPSRDGGGGGWDSSGQSESGWNRFGSGWGQIESEGTDGEWRFDPRGNAWGYEGSSGGWRMLDDEGEREFTERYP